MGSVAGRLAVIVFKHSGLQGESEKKEELGRLTLRLLMEAALKAAATMCPVKHE